MSFVLPAEFPIKTFIHTLSITVFSLQFRVQGIQTLSYPPVTKSYIRNPAFIRKFRQQIIEQLDPFHDSHPTQLTYFGAMSTSP